MTVGGLYQGRVVHASDPQGKRRVRLQVPQVSGSAVSGWAPPVQTGGRIPAVGEMVWVTYQGGDVSYPAYLPPIPPPSPPPRPQPYTPQWVSSGNPQPSVGDGSFAGMYTKVGALVSFSITLTWGAATTNGNGSYQLTLPFPSMNYEYIPAVATGMAIGGVRGGVEAQFSSGRAALYGATQVGSDTFAQLDHNGFKGAWRSGSVIRIFGSYFTAE